MARSGDVLLPALRPGEYEVLAGDAATNMPIEGAQAWIVYAEEQNY